MKRKWICAVGMMLVLSLPGCAGAASDNNGNLQITESAIDNAASEKSTSEKSTSEKSASENLSSENSASEEVDSEEEATEILSSEKEASEKEASEKEALEKASEQVPAEEPQKVVLKDGWYTPVLDFYYELLLQSGTDPETEEDYSSGVWEIMNSHLAPEALESVGFRLEDLDGDKVEELMLFAIDERKDGIAFGSNLLALYDLVDRKPTKLADGWSRNSYTALGDGRFYYFGSAGAMYSMFGFYGLYPGSEGFECSDFYFTYEKDPGNWDTIGYFHNTIGEWNPESSEELEITEEEFWELEEELSAGKVALEVTPFSAYR